MINVAPKVNFAPAWTWPRNSRINLCVFVGSRKMRTGNVPIFRGEKPKCREMSTSQRKERSYYYVSPLLPSHKHGCEEEEFTSRSVNHESGYDSNIPEFNKQKTQSPIFIELHACLLLVSCSQ